MNVTSRKGHVCEVTANPEGGTNYKFTLVKLTAAPPGCETTMWAINYHPQQKEEPSSLRRVKPGEAPRWPGLRPVYGMTNPKPAEELGIKAAVAGDYDLWCVFPHSSVGGSGVADRLMPLRANLVSGQGRGPTMQKLLSRFPDAEASQPAKPGSFVSTQAASAKLIFESSNERNEMANAKEDKHLGNISHTIMKIRNELNAACASKAGNVVQHSDYGGNPFATIDFPLIFFVPDPSHHFSHAETLLASDMIGLKGILRSIERRGYILKLNPAWSIPLY